MLLQGKAESFGIKLEGTEAVVASFVLYLAAIAVFQAETKAKKEAGA